MKPCLEPGCMAYVLQGSSRVHRCRQHQAEYSRAYERIRDQRPERIAYRDPAYKALPKPYGQACALQYPGVCTGAATTWDHKTPISKGGTHHPSNLQPACRQCNSARATRIRDEI